MRRGLLYLLAALAAGSLLFGWGYRRGVASVEVVESLRTVPVYYEKPEPVRVTHTAASVRVPVLLFAPADTVRETVVARVGREAAYRQQDIALCDQCGLYEGSGCVAGGRERFGYVDTVDSVELRFGIERQEYGGRDTTFYAVVSGPAVGGFRPRLERLELYAAERIRTSVIRKPYRWEIGPAAGVWYAPAGGGVWAGGFVRRSFGRLSLTAVAGYDTRNGGAFGQVQAGVAVWRR